MIVPSDAEDRIIVSLFVWTNSGTWRTDGQSDLPCASNADAL